MLPFALRFRAFATRVNEKVGKTHVDFFVEVAYELRRNDFAIVNDLHPLSGLENVQESANSTTVLGTHLVFFRHRCVVV